MKKLFQKTGAALLACIMVFTAFSAHADPAFAAEKTGLYEGQPARFSYGTALKTADGQTYQFTGKDLNWMQMYCYNYQTGQPYTGGARELAGALERYRIKTAAGSFVGYCIEHGVMVDEALQLQAADYRNAVITAGLGEDVMQNIKLCLFYGRQNGDSIGNLLNSPENGGLGFSESGYYGRNASSYTLDDWEMATAMLIRESQQKFRDSRFRLKSGGNGLCYTDGWRGPETGSINSDHYVKPLKGKGAYDIYKYMEQLCQDHFLFSTSIASMNPAVPKDIGFGAEDRDEAGNYYKKISVSSSRAYPLKAVDKDDPSREAAGVTVQLTEENGKYYYELTVAPEAFSESAVFGLVKVFPGRVPANDLLVWECKTTNGHLQAITTGMADPMIGYFSLSTKAEPVQGESPEPEYFPVFEFPVSKEDLNPGWDGSVNTPMGDAVLSATYVLYRDGTEVDRVNLDEYGSTAFLTDQPWTSEEDLVKAESGETALHMVDNGGDSPEQVDHGCGIVAPTKAEWSGSCSYTIREIVPDGRFVEPDAYNGQREYSVSYYAVTEDERSFACEGPAWKDIEYTVSYDTVKGSGSGGDTGPASAENLEEILVFGEETFVNDCYRGKFTLSKSLEREDVFKDSTLGGHPDSTGSQWKLYLADGGFEESPYARFVREDDMADGTAVYRVTREQSGADNSVEKMVIGNNGDMVVYDIPYGTYWMEEVRADDLSFVREKFLIEIGEHDGPYTPDNDYDNRYDYNVRDKKITNRIKILKTDSETGKGVDLAGTKFNIRYKGSPLNTESQNQELENYNRYLPNAAEITSDGPYTFEADENGELTIQYELPYGIYEITEWQVPEGYYIEGEGNVYTFAVDEQPVHTDGNFGQKVTYDGLITAADPLYDSSQYPYTAYYQAVAIENNQTKGRIAIEKKGEILTGFAEETVLGQKVFRPVFEMAGKLKDAVFGVFAAEDIILKDGNDGPAIYDALTNEEIIIPKEKATHYGALEIIESGSMIHSSGAELSYIRERESGHSGAAGEDNHYIRTYISPEQPKKTYSHAFEKADDNFAYRWDVNASMNYQAGGRNITGVKIVKTTTALNPAMTEIPLTRPAAVVKDSGNEIVLNPAENYICGNPSADGNRTSNALSILEKSEAVTSPEGFQQQITQTYDVSFVQEAENSEGFSLSWDGFEISSEADQEARKAVTAVTCDGVTEVFEMAEPEAPVYFLSADGIRTEMYYYGGFLKAKLEIPQSAVDKDFDKIMPDMGFDWYTSLTPAKPEAEYEPVRGTKVKATRHENTETGKAESYTVEIVSSQTKEIPFEVSFADGYKMAFFTETDELGNGRGVMVLDGVYKTTRYTLSELVEIISTDETGRAESSLLPLGKYHIRELEAPDCYISDGWQETVILEHENQFVPVVWEGVSTDNEHVYVEIDIEKRFETAWQSDQYEAGRSAVFGVYTSEKIGNIYEPDTLVGVIATDKAGKGLKRIKLPAGYMYYVREIEAPDQYITDSKKYYFETRDDVRSDQCRFAYEEDGIFGNVIMEGYGRATITIETLECYPAVPLMGTVILTATEDNPVRLTMANGKTAEVIVRGNTFTCTVDGFLRTYVPQVVSTGYYYSMTREWDGKPSDTICINGPDGLPLLKAEISHESEQGEQGKTIYVHTAVVETGEGETADIKAGERKLFTAEKGRVEVFLDNDGHFYVTAGGITDGLISGENQEEFSKSVTFARQHTDSDTIQVKINTSDNLNAGIIFNRHKDVSVVDIPSEPELPLPEPEPVPQEPEPEPEPEPEEILPEPEQPEDIPVAVVPETGDSSHINLWLITAAASLICLFYLRKKEKEI